MFKYLSASVDLLAVPCVAHATAGVMNLLRSSAVATLFSAIYVASAHATLITETWTSTVAFATHTAFTAGDTFDWTVTYDDASLIMHVYSDGLNGVAQFGGGDDQVIETICTQAASGGVGCTSSYGLEYSLFADAVIDLSAFYSVMQAAGLTGTDAGTSNLSWRYTRDSGQRVVQYVADDLAFAAVDGIITTAITRTGEIAHGTSFTSTLISTELAAVPEPATATLMGLGLVGLGFSRRRRIKRLAA